MRLRLTGPNPPPCPKCNKIQNTQCPVQLNSIVTRLQQNKALAKGPGIHRAPSWDPETLSCDFQLPCLKHFRKVPVPVKPTPGPFCVYMPYYFVLADVVYSVLSVILHLCFILLISWKCTHIIWSVEKIKSPGLLRIGCVWVFLLHQMTWWI